MATDEEIYKIIMKIEGDDKVKQLSAALAQEEKLLLDNIAGFGRLSSQAKQTANSIADLTAQLKAAEAASGIASHKVMALGQTIDDLQYVGEQGLRPIINNIMQLSPLLGIALIAAQQLYTHWDSLMGLFGKGGVKTQAEQMEELGKKTAKTADETARLAKYERERKNIQEQETAPTKAQSEQAKQVNEAIVEGPVSKVDEAIKAIYGQQVRNATPQDQIDARDLFRREESQINAKEAGLKPGQQLSPMEKARRDQLKSAADQIDKAIDDKVNEWVRDFRGKVATDPKALKAFTDTLEASGKDPGLVAKLREAQKTPKDKEVDEAVEQIQKDLADQDFKDRHKALSDREKKDKEVQEAEEQAQKDIEDQEFKDRHKALSDREKKDKEVDEAVEDVQKNIADREFADRHDELADTEARSRKEVDLTRDYQDQTMKEAMKAPDRRKSSVIGAEGLASSIQSAVGGPDKIQERMLKQQEKQTEYLRAIAENRAGALNVGFQANGVLGVN